MRIGVHEYTGEYCPWCYSAMLRVIVTGHQFCESNSPYCDYEVTETGIKPVSKALHDELIEINQAHKREKLLLRQKYDQLREDAIARHGGKAIMIGDAIQLTEHELNLFRQWFDSVQDLNGGRLETDDYVLAEKIYKRLGMRVPNSIADKLPKK